MLSEHARVGQLRERTIVLDSSKEKKNTCQENETITKGYLY